MSLRSADCCAVGLELGIAIGVALATMWFAFSYAQVHITSFAVVPSRSGAVRSAAQVRLKSRTRAPAMQSQARETPGHEGMQRNPASRPWQPVSCSLIIASMNQFALCALESLRCSHVYTRSRCRTR